MTRFSLKRRWPILLVLALFWLAVSACSCGDAIATVSRQVSKRSNPAPSVVLAPTATRRPLPTATLVVPTRAVPEQGELALPGQAGEVLDMTLTEDQITEYLAGQTLDQQGVQVEDVRVTITSDEIIANLRATYSEAGISAGLQVRGEPVIFEGDLYIKVNKVELDQSVSGFMRLIANQLIERAIDQYSTEQGIPIPLEEIEIERIELAPQMLHIVGKRR